VAVTAAAAPGAPTRTLAPILAAALLAGGCALGTGDAPQHDAARLPGTSDRVDPRAACVGDLQSCANGERCCSGLTCAPHGRYGMLCRRPAVGGG
jgi:hypothetical protein